MEADYHVVFDGGSLGNPGKGYGSFAIIDRAGGKRITRLDFGTDVTNNEAEYRTLIAALETLLREAENPGETTIAVCGDSLLVVHQVSGRWRVRSPHLQPLQRQARELLRRFGRAELTWQPRNESVALLGH